MNTMIERIVFPAREYISFKKKTPNHFTNRILDYNKYYIYIINIYNIIIIIYNTIIIIYIIFIIKYIDYN